MSDPTPRNPAAESVAIVGLGNIGSQTSALLPGVEALGHVLLIDPDHYESANLGRQRITPRDVGRLKVEVQAKALRKIAPHLRVETFAQPIEALPLGLLRGCVILSCVDSRVARQAINRRACALGSPWIDAALDRDGQVRSRTYWPGVGDCLECAWGERDYELLEQLVPCAHLQSGEAAPQINPTAAPQELGAIAAALQVAQLRRALSAAPADAASCGRQSFFDVSSGRGWVGSYSVNSECRLDHSRWQVTELARGAADLALSEALRLPGGDAKDSAIALEGQMFVRRLRCTRCGFTRQAAMRVHSRIRARACRKCGERMSASAREAIDVLSARSVPRNGVDTPLSVFGLVNNDIFSVRALGRTSHYQLCGARPAVIEEAR